MNQSIENKTKKMNQKVFERLGNLEFPLPYSNGVCEGLCNSENHDPFEIREFLENICCFASYSEKIDECQDEFRTQLLNLKYSYMLGFCKAGANAIKNLGYLYSGPKDPPEIKIKYPIVEAISKYIICGGNFPIQTEESNPSIRSLLVEHTQGLLILADQLFDIKAKCFLYKSSAFAYNACETSKTVSLFAKIICNEWLGLLRVSKEAQTPLKEVQNFEQITPVAMPPAPSKMPPPPPAIPRVIGFIPKAKTSCHLPPVDENLGKKFEIQTQDHYSQQPQPIQNNHVKPTPTLPDFWIFESLYPKKVSDLEKKEFLQLVEKMNKTRAIQEESQNQTEAKQQEVEKQKIQTVENPNFVISKLLDACSIQKEYLDYRGCMVWASVLRILKDIEKNQQLDELLVDLREKSKKKFKENVDMKNDIRKIQDILAKHAK